MEFLKARKDDLDNIMSLYKNVIASTFTTWDEYYPSKELIENDILSGNLYLLKENNEIIAVSFLGLKEEENEDWSHKLNYPLGVARICVNHKWQGKGIGKYFMLRLIEEAKNRGADGMHFHVATINKAAMKMYEGVGFTNCGLGKSNYGFDFYKYEMVFK